MDHGILRRECISIFAEINFRVRYGAPYVGRLRKFKVNLYRRTPPQSRISILKPSTTSRYSGSCCRFCMAYTWYRIRSGCRVGLLRLLRRADFVSAPPSGSMVSNGMGPLRARKYNMETGCQVAQKIRANLRTLPVLYACNFSAGTAVCLALLYTQISHTVLIVV